MTTINIDSIEPGSPTNPPCSTAGGTWCYVAGTGLFLHNTITGVIFGNLALAASDWLVLSDQDMWFRAPATSAFVKSNGEHVEPGDPSFDVEFEYTTAAGTDLTKQSPFVYGYLPAVEAVTAPPVCSAAPPVLWVPKPGDPPIQGMVTLNEKAPFGGMQPVMSSDNPEVSVGQPTVPGPTVPGGPDGKTTATFPITVHPTAKVGSIVNISSGPGPGMDTFGDYASLAAVIGCRRFISACRCRLYPDSQPPAWPMCNRRLPGYRRR